MTASPRPARPFPGAVEISPPRGPVSAVVRPPGSKYEANRLLVIAALTDGERRILGAPDGEDIRAAAAAVRALGAETAEADGEIRVRGLPAPERAEAGGHAANGTAAPALADAGESGTLLRFLTAAAATSPTPVRIVGRGRLPERPLEGLLRALVSLGAVVRTEGSGSVPLTVRSGEPGGGLRGGRALLPASETSQFASALVIAAGRALGGLEVELRSEPVSASYLDLTLSVMARCGASVERRGPRRLFVPAGTRYRPGASRVSGDWASASYLFAAAALAPGRVRALGLDGSPGAGEREFPEHLRRMGCRVEEGDGPDGPDGPDGFEVEVEGPADGLRGIEADCARMPDTAPTLAVAAAFAAGPSRLHGVEHLRHKESDRIASLRRGLAGLGARTEFAGGALTIHPADPPARGSAPPVFDPDGDHRIAMAFALAGLRRPGGVRVRSPGVVAKSFPAFWDEIAGLGVRVRPVEFP